MLVRTNIVVVPENHFVYIYTVGVLNAFESSDVMQNIFV